MSELQWIKGDDPACERGAGLYLVTTDPTTAADAKAQNVDVGFESGHGGFWGEMYYAGPIAVAMPALTLPTTVVLKCPRGPLPPGLYLIRPADSCKSPYSVFHGGGEANPGSDYYGPIALGETPDGGGA